MTAVEIVIPQFGHYVNAQCSSCGLDETAELDDPTVGSWSATTATEGELCDNRCLGIHCFFLLASTSTENRDVNCFVKVKQMNRTK